VAEQLQAALTTRVVIEQAKGVLAEFGKVDMEVAFGAMRAFARSSNRKLGDVARALVHRHIDPATVLTGAQQRRG
jgi:AmiR/NasT family two-component response regulator